MIDDSQTTDPAPSREECAAMNKCGIALEVIRICVSGGRRAEFYDLNAAAEAVLLKYLAPSGPEAPTRTTT